MMTALLLAAALAPAAPLPVRAREGVPCQVDTEFYPWLVYVRFEPGIQEGLVVPPGMVLTVDGRRAGLGELPGLLNQAGPGVRGSGPVWRRAKACRAWTRGGRLEALEVTLR
jgi:hypothetical protein